MNEEKKEEDLLNKCMQSMSIEEQGEHLMLTWQPEYWWCAKGGGRDCELCPLSTFRTDSIVIQVILVCSETFTTI